MNRRASTRALLALCAGQALAWFTGDAAEARKRRHDGNRHNPRKRLRRQCRKQCDGVHRDCLDLCHSQGYDDDICHPRCSIAKHSCQRGC